jgi:drug/metabolite transporter (DMT)-like permease
VKAWLLVGIIVGATVMGDLLQSREMKRGRDLRKRYLAVAIGFMAISFFAFMKLVSFADLSFAVPATAGSLVLETLLARMVLKERVDRKRWAGVALVAFGVALLAR